MNDKEIIIYDIESGQKVCPANLQPIKAGDNNFWFYTTLILLGILIIK